MRQQSLLFSRILRKCSALLILAIIIGIYLSSHCLADNKKSLKKISVTITQVETQNFPQVLLYATISDNRGLPLPKINTEDIIISERGAINTQPLPAGNITIQNSAGKFRGVSVALVFDASGSMWGRLPQIREATHALFNTMSLNDRASVTIFSTEVRVTQPFVGKSIDSDLDGTTDLETALSTYQSGGKTALYDALELGIGQLEMESGIKAIVIFADGEDNISKTTKKQVINHARESNIPVYTIGLGLKLDPTHLKDIAAKTGGRYYSAPGVETIKAIYDDFFKSVTRQFEIAYTTPIDRIDATTRQVSLRIKGYELDADSTGKSYTITKSPEIHLDKKTIALSRPGFQHSYATPIYIQAIIIDDSPPQTIKAILFYRTVGEKESFSQVPMAYKKKDNLFHGVIPSSAVVNPGLEYYLLASDGKFSTTSPKEGATANQTYQIAVDPNFAPFLVHFKPKLIKPDQGLTIKAKVWDMTMFVDSVKVFYRHVGKFHYSAMEIPEIKSNLFQVKIPLINIPPAGIQYYISAYDDHGIRSDNGSADNPHLVKAIAPEIKLDAKTLAFSDPRYYHDPNETIPIAINVKDDWPPEKIKSFIYYRRAGKKREFTRKRLKYIEAKNHYSTTIPPEHIKGKALEYYITVADDLFTVPLPLGTKNRPGLNRIKLKQNLSSHIQHKAIKVALVGELTRISAFVTLPDTTVKEVMFFYRNSEDQPFSSIPMKAVDETQYQTALPISAFTTSGIQYYITAMDSHNNIFHHGTEDYPHQIVGIEMVFIKGGCFDMGDTFMLGQDNEKPVHEVCLDDFYLGKHEVTQKLWETLMYEENPSYYQAGDAFPVENVSWEDIQVFLQRINQGRKEKFYLPTEAEWEYACKGGEQRLFGLKDPLKTVENLHHDMANYDGTGGMDQWNSPSPIGSFPANQFGLHELSGNVWEWVQDSYDRDFYKRSRENNPVNNRETRNKIIRGGGWLDAPKDLRCSNRNYIQPSYKSRFIGLRLKMEK